LAKLSHFCGIHFWGTGGYIILHNLNRNPLFFFFSFSMYYIGVGGQHARTQNSAKVSPRALDTPWYNKNMQTLQELLNEVVRVNAPTRADDEIAAIFYELHGVIPSLARISAARRALGIARTYKQRRDIARRRRATFK
jgi:hypothetical protein